MYAFRMVFLTFFGEARQQVSRLPGPAMRIPLVVLAILSIVAGFLYLPATFGHISWFKDFTLTALPAVATARTGVPGEAMLQVITSVVSLVGIFLAGYYFLLKPDYTETLAKTRAGSLLHTLWFAGWGFDWLYDTVLVRPFVELARLNREDFIDLAYRAAARLTAAGARLLSPTESGKVRSYAMGIAFGAIVILGIVILSS